MNKRYVDVLKSQKGQGVWEYVITIIGAVALGFVVSNYMKNGLTQTGGAADKVINKVESTINGISTP